MAKIEHNLTSVIIKGYLLTFNDFHEMQFKYLCRYINQTTVNGNHFMVYGSMYNSYTHFNIHSNTTGQPPAPRNPQVKSFQTVVPSLHFF